MDFIYELSMSEIAVLHVIIGLINLLITVKSVFNSQDAFQLEDLREQLGKVVLITVLAWPYTLVCWIFSWPIWLMPVRDLIPRIEYINTIFVPSLAIMLILLAEFFGFITIRLS